MINPLHNSMILGQHEEDGKENKNKLFIQTKNRKAKNSIQGILVGIT